MNNSATCMIGHNRKSCAFQFEELAQSPRPFKEIIFNIRDFLEATSGMSLEEKGFYVDFLMRLYRAGKPLPGDKKRGAKAMGMNARVYSRLRDKLVSGGKIMSGEGHLSHPDFENDISKRIEGVAKQIAGMNRAKKVSPKNKKISFKISDLSEAPLKIDQWVKRYTVSPKLKKKCSKINGLTEAPLDSDQMVKESEVTAKNKNKPNKNNDLTQAPLGFDQPVKNDEVTPKQKTKCRKNNDLSKAPLSKKAKKPEYSEDFEEFWDLYPRKIGKGEASKRWERLTLTQKRRAYVALRQQLDHLRDLASREGGKYCPHASTWIYQGRYDDDVAPAQPKRQYAPVGRLSNMPGKY